MSLVINKDEYLIREVWNDNLEEEFQLIQSILDKYRYIAMDTEFPGVVVRHVATFNSLNEFNYQHLKVNVDLLKLIQLGLTFFDENGELPTCGTGQKCVWQFNFCDFNINEDMYNNDSIQLLVQSGLDLQKMNEKGIRARTFSELLIGSGIVLNEDVVWVTFHSGHDFGYLLKMLTCVKLPDTPEEFFKLINVFFPKVYDIKHLMRFCGNLHGGLNKLAAVLNVQRFGTCHQAGSDSLLTCHTFVKLKNTYFHGSPERHAGVLYGLGVDG